MSAAPKDARSWQTRAVSMVCITAITALGMFLGIDGVAVPAIGMAAVGGIAGYDLGMEQATRLLTGGGQ